MEQIGFFQPRDFKLSMLLTVLFVIYILILQKNTKVRNLKHHSNHSNQTSSKTLVMYAYYEKNQHHIEAFRFFRDLGISERDDIDFLIIIQGYNCSVKIPNFSNIKILKRPNNCYDFGAYGDAIKSIGGASKLAQYKVVIILNSSVFGPILPKYWPQNHHWSRVFTSQLNENIHVTSTIITCLPGWSYDGKGPRMTGMAFAAYSQFIIEAYKNCVFRCFNNKQDVTLNGEFGITKLSMKLNYQFNTLLLKYGNINWLDPNTWECNGNNDPFKEKLYDQEIQMDIHPLETVFYKPIWIYEEKILSLTFLNETYKYMQWARERAGIAISD